MQRDTLRLTLAQSHDHQEGAGGEGRREDRGWAPLGGVPGGRATKWIRVTDTEGRGGGGGARMKKSTPFGIISESK